MHGRVKVKTSEQQRLQKEKEQQKKLLAYRGGMKKIIGARDENRYDPEHLALCWQLLAANPDIYTLWNYRKQAILVHLEKESKESNGDEKAAGDGDEMASLMESELQLTEQSLLVNPKSYGAWHHRYWILKRHPKPNWQREFSLCNKYLKMDDRNFHVWDYRRLITAQIGVPLDDEIEFSTECLNENFSNYSSWHYRSLLRKLDGESAIETELGMVENAIFTDPADSSAWFYLRWILSHPRITEKQKDKLFVSLQQLQSSEPNCKWIIIAKCWLATVYPPAAADSVEYRRDLDKLETLDPLRKGRYKDLLLLEKPGMIL